jgi:hypothetical protein
MRAPTIETSPDWVVVDSVLCLKVTTKMEFDLVRRFLGVIAEVVAHELGAAQRLDVRLGDSAASEGQGGRGAENGRDTGNGVGMGNGRNAGSGHNDGSGYTAGAGGASSSGADGAGTLAKEGASETAIRPGAAAMSPEEAAVVAAVEKCFKGSLMAVSDAAAAGDSAPSIAQGGSRAVGSAQGGPAHADLSASGRANDLRRGNGFSGANAADAAASDATNASGETGIDGLGIQAPDKDGDEDSFYSDPFYDEPF